jgi:flagellar assembly protein FliH
MAATLTTNLAKPIKSVAILSGHGGPSSGRTSPNEVAGLNQADSEPQGIHGLKRELEAQKAAFSQINQALREVTAKLNKFYNTAFAAHKEEIAKLSVEIAGKILAQKVEDRDYEIESIVREALNNAPSHQDVVVHLNPEDLVQYQKARRDEPSEESAGIKFVPDPHIGRAECLLETPKGIVESLIEQHLEQIAKALKKVE